MARRCLLLALAASAAAQQPASISLENPDGQRLDFLRLTVGAALFGPFAFVENELVFRNPEPRRMEGRFSFALPVGPDGPAAPSRFAMEIFGRLMEGEVVNRSKARAIYREILHEARDPALLEQGPGNIFTARVFPIEANAVVRLILSYSLTLPLRASRRALVLPMRGLPSIEKFSFAATVATVGGGADVDANCSLPGFGSLAAVPQNGAVRFATASAMALTPDADAVIEVREAPGSSPPSLSVDGGSLVSSFTLDNASFPMVQPPAFAPKAWSVYVDTSASTADTSAVRVPMIAALLDAMPEVDVEVFAFDIEVVSLRAKGPKDAALGLTVRSALENRLPLGATDLEQVMKHVEANAKAPAGGSVGVLLVTDAIPTAKERAAARLGQLLSEQSGRVVEVAVIGNKFDTATGTAIAANGNGRIVHLPLTSKELPAAAAKAWADLTKPLGARASPKVSSGWVWPEAVADLHAGDEVVVYSGGSTGQIVPKPELTLTFGGGNGTLVPGQTQTASAAFGALLSREATRARLELLEAQRQLATTAAQATALQEEIITLSVSKRVMSPHTALLVLETEQDYIRFGIPRANLAPILVTTDTGVELRERKDLLYPDLPSTTTTTMGTTVTTSTSTPNMTCSSSQQLSSCQSQQEDLSEVSDVARAAEAMMQSSGASVSAARGARSGILIALLLCLFTCVSEAGWADPKADAAKTLKEFGDNGPAQRFRDNATKYASALLATEKSAELKSYCARWLTWDPSNTLVFEYLSKAGQLLSEPQLALRAATSVAEIAPRDPEQLLRGAWISMALATEQSADWAVRLAVRALEERQDNPNTYRALALAHWRAGNHLEAAQAYQKGLGYNFNSRYGDIARVFREEAALFLRAVEATDTQLGQSLRKQLPSVGVDAGKGISLRITMSWLTDANDVDLHVIDPRGAECYYSQRKTSLLELYSDQTQGLGPEVIVMNNQRVAGKYKIGVKYFSSGAMGASRGTVVVWDIRNGVPAGPAKIEAFTLPAGYSDVLPILEVSLA